MPDETQLIDSNKGTVRKTRIVAADWKRLAEFICDTYHKRKKNPSRKHKEQEWKEIDRQLKMEPDTRRKLDNKGNEDKNKKWMAEMELPHQSVNLEISMSDVRKLIFGPHWFEANALVTDSFERNIENVIKIAGDETEMPSIVTQENVDKIIEGVMGDVFKKTDFMARHDLVVAESYKYGTACARALVMTANQFYHTSQGVHKIHRNIPIFMPQSIKRTYPDDTPPTIQSTHIANPLEICEETVLKENIILAAKQGSKDPNDIDGGWMPRNLGKLVPNKEGKILLIEAEGDIVIERKNGESIFVPNVIVTVAEGQENSTAVIRFRFRAGPYSSYCFYHYHREHIEDPYATSPLMKGRPLQIMATHALNLLMDSGTYKNDPTRLYDANDQYMADQGGPVIAPGVSQESLNPEAVRVLIEAGGDPATLLQVFSLGMNMYADLSGILPARIGAQTKSHTTAFAKESEEDRGAARTVDFVETIGNGPLQRYLHIAYNQIRDTFKDNSENVYIPAYRGYVEIDQAILPETCGFKWLGIGGARTPEQEAELMFVSANQAIQLDQVNSANKAQGIEGNINVEEIQRQMLLKGGWSNVDKILNRARPIEINTGDGGVSGVDPGLAGNVSTALQGLQNSELVG